jgi:hypothetical protein
MIFGFERRIMGITHYSIVPTFHQESSEKLYALLITQIPIKDYTDFYLYSTHF